MCCCPDCKSSDIKTLRMACLTGISNSEGTVDLISAENGFFGVATAKTTSLLVRAIAPPQKKKIPLSLILFSFFFLPSLFYLRKLEREYKKWNDEEYPELLAAWEQCWICLKCGNVFSFQKEEE